MMMRRTTTTLGLAGAVMLVCLVPSSSDPNLIGVTGLLLNPTADLGEGGQDLQLTYLPVRNATETTHWYSVAGRYRLDERTELHGALEAMRATNDREGLAFGLKRQVQAETATLPAVALGAYHDSILKDTAAYAVASLDGVHPTAGTPTGLRGHLGLRWDRFEDGRNESAVTGFMGLEARIGDKTTFFGEVGTQHHDRVHQRTPWAVGFRWSPSAQRTFTAGVITPAYGFARDAVLVVAARWGR